MSYRSFRRLLAGALVATLPLSACTSTPQPAPPPTTSLPAFRLVAFDSCEQLLTDLRKAARTAVGPWGLSNDWGHWAQFSRADAAMAKGAEAAAPAARGTDFSGTNNHEADADEPDLVKTDGRRIVTVNNGVLRVVDAASRKQTGRLNLGVNADGRGGSDLELLLSGDHALVLVPGSHWWVGSSAYRGKIRPTDGPVGPQLLLVDLAGAPTVVSRYRTDGQLVDARQTGSTARVVLRATPRFDFPRDPRATDEKKMLAKNRAVIDMAPADAWLPSYEVTTGGKTQQGRVECDRVSRPTDFSGTSMVTVLTFDLAADALGNGDPVSVVADGDTVYGTGSSLYIASDQRWRRNTWRGGAESMIAPKTEIHRFDTTGTARPTYAASGSVPGWLLNQYALSEWDGHLRVATTARDSGDGFAGPSPSASAGSVSASAIRVLKQQGGTLVETGKVDGLGKGEQIYSVRFIGPRGYVVTFRQTDPLYSVDLTDPAKPTVTGELKITGYSAHLQPAGDNRLIGIGQEADKFGRTQGTQVSLFDVADPTNPKRLAQHHIAGGYSEAEYDPHALLWWPGTNLLVVPMTVYNDDAVKQAQPTASALALRVTDTGMTEIDAITQPATTSRDVNPTIRRTLVIGNVLWSVSDAGLQATDLSTMDPLGWLPTA